MKENVLILKVSKKRIEGGVFKLRGVSRRK